MIALKLFKTADKKLGKLGFEKTHESESYVVYERDCAGRPNQIVTLDKKSSLRHLIASFKNDVDGPISLGITMYESKLFIRKMREKGWEIVKY